MQRIEFDHWFVNNNELSISLMRYFVKIESYVVDDDLCVMLTVIDDNINNLELCFTRLEDAISFAENEINGCKSFEEILERYANVLYGIKLTLR